MVRSAPRPASPKNTGMNRAMISPRSCSSMCRVRIGDWPTRMPATKAPSTVWTPIRLVMSAIRPITTRMVVMTGISLTKVSLVQRIRVNTSRRPSVKLTTRNSAVPSTLCASVARSTPPWSARPKMIAMMVQPIVSSMMAEATITWPTSRRMKRISRTTMATIFTEEIDSAVPRKSEVIRRRLGSRQHRLGQHLAEREAAGERHGDAGGRDAERRAARLPDQGEVGLHAGEQQQHEDAELGDGIDHALLLAIGREDRVLGLRPERAEHRRPEQKAGEQLPHDGRLADPLHDLAHETADREQKNDLPEEDHLRGAGLLGLGGEGGRGREERQRERRRWAKPVFCRGLPGAAFNSDRAASLPLFGHAERLSGGELRRNQSPPSASVNPISCVPGGTEWLPV